MDKKKVESLDIENQSVFFTSSESMGMLEDNSVTLVVTSPPYWDVRDYGGKQLGFNQSYKEYIESLNRVWAECIRVLQPNGKMAINIQPLPISAKKSGYNRRIIQDIMFDIQKFMYSQDLFLSGMVYWNKAPYINNVSWGSYPKPTNIATNTAFEQIYTFVKPGKTRKFDRSMLDRSLLDKNEWRHWAVRMIWDDISPVIKINQKGENKYGHGAPFPEDIPYRLIRMHTLEGETVLDPFLGSGTTLKMARLTNRKGIGFEINPKYRDRIQERIKEDWNLKIPDSQYKTYSSQEITDIIWESLNQTILLLEEKNMGIKGEMMKNTALLEELTSSILSKIRNQSIFSKANKKRIQELIEKKLKEPNGPSCVNF